MPTQQSEEQSPCKLQGTLLPAATLSLYSADLEVLALNLKRQRLKSRFSFGQIPVALCLQTDGLLVQQKALYALLNDLGIKLIGLQGEDEQTRQLAEMWSLPLFPAGRTPKAQTEEAKTNTAADTPASDNRLIDRQVRSGQRIYVQGDLTITASVSAGAEVMADGNIHIYGALRGRALAGANGNKQARIFCHTLAAELVAIAGVYQLSEQINPDMAQRPQQVWLDAQQTLHIDAF